MKQKNNISGVDNKPDLIESKIFEEKYQSNLLFLNQLLRILDNHLNGKLKQKSE